MLVTAPLVVGLLISGLQIEQVTRSSERLFDQAVTSTRAARAVQDRLTAYERAARHYLVLHDAEARSHLLQQVDAFGRKLETLRLDAVEPELIELLDQLQSAGGALSAQVLIHAQADDWPETLGQGFRGLDRLTAALLDHSDAASDRASRRLERLGDRARTAAMLQLTLFIPFTMVLALVFTALISRPIRRLDDSIRALAQPEADPVPRVRMPRDLRALSVRLEWVRRKLVRTERDRRRLLGQVSHELKTPLSAIREGISLLDDQVFGTLGAEQLEVIAILNTNAQRLQEQIESLLRFNRLRAGYRPVNQAKLPISELIQEVLGNHALAIAAGKIRTTVQIDPKAQVKGDRDMLQTALDNLLSNALKYASSGYCLGVFATMVGHEVRIEVADRGPGIRPEDRGRIFEPFYRGRPELPGSVPGSGLGLAICRDLVRAHGGELEMVERPGWATVFRITLTSMTNEEPAHEHA